MKKTIAIIFLSCAAGLFLVLLAGVTTIDGPWLKLRLVEKIEASLEAKARIQTVVFSAWSGEAEIADVLILREKKGAKFQAKLGSAKARIRVLPLLLRTVILDSLELVRPDITFSETRPADAEPRPTLDRLKGALKQAIDGVTSGALRARVSTTAKRRPPDIFVQRLVVRDGSATYRVLKEGAAPFEAVLRRLTLDATDVVLNSFSSLVDRATIDAEIVMGSPARLAVKSKSDGGIIHVEGLDLGYLDRYFNQKDAIVFQSGRLDIQHTRSSGSGIHARIEGLRLAKHAPCPINEFYFVPVETLIQYVEAKEGKLTLALKSPLGEGWSDDLHSLMSSVWEGFVLSLVKDAGVKGLQLDKKSISKFLKK